MTENKIRRELARIEMEVDSRSFAAKFFEASEAVSEIQRAAIF